jgi:hypothetical protein
VCGVADPPPVCTAERRAVTEGVPVGTGPGAFADRPVFVYLAAEERYYRTSVRWVDGARTAVGRPVAYETVRDAVAHEGAAAFDPPADAVVADVLEAGVARSRSRVVLERRAPGRAGRRRRRGVVRRRPTLRDGTAPAAVRPPPRRGRAPGGSRARRSRARRSRGSRSPRRRRP